MMIAVYEPVKKPYFCRLIQNESLGNTTLRKTGADSGSGVKNNTDNRSIIWDYYRSFSEKNQTKTFSRSCPWWS
jgi:hypothetical protein